MFLLCFIFVVIIGGSHLIWVPYQISVKNMLKFVFSFEQNTRAFHICFCSFVFLLILEILLHFYCHRHTMSQLIRALVAIQRFYCYLGLGV